MKARWQISIAFAALWMLLPFSSVEALGAKAVAAETGGTAAGSAAGLQNRAVLLILRTGGFEPHEFRVPAGPVALRIINRSPIPEVRVIVEREDGTSPEQSVQDSTRRDRKWSVRFNLSPGTYRLRLAGVPSIFARIIVGSEGR